MNLRPTHHGYAYQDVLTGNAFVDLLLGVAVSVKVDLKDFDGDRFDDITIIYEAAPSSTANQAHHLRPRAVPKTPSAQTDATYVSTSYCARC